MDIVIIGSGNVARVFMRLISKTSHRLAGIVCRNPDSLPEVQKEGIRIQKFHENILPADLYITAVSDQFLVQLKDNIRLQGGIIVHTAGSVSADVLKPILPRYGVIYPLQSLRKELNTVPEIPLLIDGSDQAVLETIQSFAREISGRVVIADDEERASYHLAAVSSANFINYLLLLVYEFCEDKGLDPAMLTPLLRETIDRLRHFSPADVQTGPAIRNDTGTISRHLQNLDHHPKLKKLYDHFTSLIQQHFNHNMEQPSD